MDNVKVCYRQTDRRTDRQKTKYPALGDGGIIKYTLICTPV